MELALNLSWLVVIGLLFASVFVAHRRKQLHLSLKLALGCAALLAVLLFPVISMTDDLQQAQLLSEWPAAHTDTSWEILPTALADTAVLLFLLLLAMAGALLVLLARLLDERKHAASQSRLQPYATRPPPYMSCMLAA